MGEGFKDGPAGKTYTYAHVEARSTTAAAADKDSNAFERTDSRLAETFIKPLEFAAARLPKKSQREL